MRLLYLALTSEFGRGFLRRAVFAITMLATIGGAGVLGYRYYGSVSSRDIQVCVLTDFSFRDQKPNWRYQLDLWFAEVNRIFERGKVKWVVKQGGEAYPEHIEGRLADRRTIIEDTATCKADVVLGFTSISDRMINSSISPFSHVGLVAVTAPDSDAIAVQTLARSLARLFGVQVSTEAMVLVDAPQSEVLDAAALSHIERLRWYDFAKGISALTGRWERKAFETIRDSFAGRKPNPAAESRRMLGRAFSGQRKQPEAVTQFREAVKLAPRDARLRFELAMALQADAQSDEAISELRAVANLDPEDARPHALAGAIFLNRNRSYEAIDELRQAVALDPGNADYQSVLGKALTTQVGHGAEAAAAFEAALRLRPADDFARQAAESINSDQDSVRGLVSQLTNEARANPSSAATHIRLGMALAAAADRAGALKALQRALELEPNNPTAHQALARVQFMEGQYAQAKENLDRAQAAGASVGKDFAAALQRKLAKP